MRRLTVSTRPWCVPSTYTARGRPARGPSATSPAGWCHVRDLVTAVDLLLENEAAFGKVLNIGNPEARATTTELADRLITLFGKGEIKRRPAKHSPIPLRTPDIGLARSLLGFEPKVGLQE